VNEPLHIAPRVLQVAVEDTQEKQATRPQAVTGRQQYGRPNVVIACIEVDRRDQLLGEPAEVGRLQALAFCEQLTGAPCGHSKTVADPRTTLNTEYPQQSVAVHNLTGRMANREQIAKLI
jgi:hypothetical protein